MAEPASSQKELDAGVDEASLWREFLVARDPDIRVDLIKRYMPLAQRIAASLYGKRPFDGLDFADYLQLARLGLIEAVDRYDPSRGASFGTYAGYRIKGSILSGLESNSEMTAQYSQRRRAVRERVASLSKRNAQGSGSEQSFEMLARTAIELALGYVLEDAETYGAESEPGEDTLYRNCELSRLREQLATIVEALPDRERMIIKGHYFEHIEFGVLAARLGLTKGRISQLHARGLGLLRDAYRMMGEFDISI